MEFDKLVDYLKKGFNDVAMNVNTVGGPIDVYILSANSYESHWKNLKLKINQ